MTTITEAVKILADMIQVTGDDQVEWVVQQNRTISWKLKDGACFQAVVKAIPDPDVVVSDDVEDDD